MSSTRARSRATVAVVGAGMAGLSAALRLAERGFQVTVYERNLYLGGQLGAHSHGEGRYHEHCYHMFLPWYKNFWQLVEDIGLSRDRHFESREVVRYLKRLAGREGPRSFALYHPGSPEHLLANVFSGVAPPPDVFLSAYSLIDLLTQRFRPGRLLDQYSVNSFMQSRPYASEHSARLHEYMLSKAFAVPSYLTSAASYQNFVRYGLREPDPMLWVLKGDSEQALIRHLTTRLTELGCAIKVGREVTQVDPRFQIHPDGTYRAFVDITSSPAPSTLPPGECFMSPADWSDDVPPTLDDSLQIVAAPWTPAPDTGPEPAPQRYDYVILAVPPAVLQPLIAPHSLGARALPREWVHRFMAVLGRVTAEEIGAPATARAALRLPQVLKLKSEPMASLDLYFTRELPDIPRDHVVLMGSRYGLTFIDNSQIWPAPVERRAPTVLNVVASDYTALANLEPIDAVWAILEELTRYVPFDTSDIDWKKLHLQTNIGDKLFVNEVGSEAFRPGPTTETPNLFIAGDFCQTPIDVVTVEAAVVSGLQAARALQLRALFDREFRVSEAQARPIEIAEPEAYPDAYIAMLKLLLTPYAYLAKAWSWMNEQLGSPDGFEPTETAAWGRLFFAPYAAAVEWWRAAADLWTGPGDATRGDR